MKKELREAFEKDSKAVTLCETQYPDINVITGNKFAFFIEGQINAQNVIRVLLCSVSYK